MLLSGMESSKSIVGIPVSSKLLLDPKLNLRCVVRIEKFNINKSSMKLLNEITDTVQDKSNKLRQVNWKNSPTSTNKNKETDRKELNIEHQRVLSKLINIESNLPSNTTNISNNCISQSPKCLRTQVKKNYAEMSISNSQELALPNSVSTKKIPIYKNQNIEEKTRKESRDLYEFDEFDYNGEKNRNRKYEFNKSEKFDKSMYDILQKIKMKEAKLQAKNKKKAGKMGKSRKYNKPMQEMRKNVLSKCFIENKSGNKAKRNKNIQNVENISKHEIQIQDINHPPNELKDKNKSSKVENIENISEHEIQILDINHPNELNDNSDRDVDKFFDFAGVEHSTPVKVNPNIKIISNLILSENDGSNLMDNLQPNANSIMLPSDKQNPWRFNENLKRNPHFITLKKTALPCLHQDLVLDYVQLEKNEHVTNKLKKIETPKKKLVQKSIMDFMNVSSCETSDKENIPHSNLFDYDEFSPTKITSSQHFSKNKVKRNVLGARQDNFENIQANNDFSQNRVPPSVTSLIEFDKNNDIETYFGFDNDNELVLSEKKSIRSEARPYRINRIVHKKHTEEAAETESLRKAENLTEYQESFKYQVEVDGKEVGLFEDPEQVISFNMPSKIYERKRRKRRLLSEDLDEEQSPKKKKNMMTKKEEAELEKWAAQFNSECEEIEKYKLEIE